MNSGIVYALLAYLVWGLFPLYFHQLASVPALEVVMHRTVWSLLFLVLVLLALKRWAWIRKLSGQPRVLGAFALSALLLSSNWLLYVWAVQNGHVQDASLGYFILPLVNVGLACVVLHERLRHGQWLAIAVATSGVIWLGVQGGQFPWIALLLALTFGVYGLLRKVAVLGSLEGLTLETMMLAPIALTYMGYGLLRGDSVLLRGGLAMNGWLMLAGPLTAIPLLLFAEAARRIPMATIGLLQYASPTMLLILSVVVFHEPLQPQRMIGFVLIWGALVLYTLEGIYVSRSRAKD